MSLISKSNSERLRSARSARIFGGNCGPGTEASVTTPEITPLNPEH